MARKGKTPKIDRDVAKAADGQAAIAEWEAENGKLTPEELAEAEARQSEKRFDIDDAINAGVVRLEGPRQLTPEEVAAAYLTPEERDAPYAAVLTTEQLAAVLEEEVDKGKDDGPAYEEPAQRVATLVSFGKDGPKYEPLESLWSMRLSILAREDGLSERDYVQKLIRRQWVARGKGG